ncbi:MHC class II beta chain, partial [Clarias magur]
MRLCAPSLLCTLTALFTLKAVDCYYGQMHMRCYYNNDNFSAKEFVVSWYFNKAEHVRYNSTTNTFTGYTDFGVNKAEALNKDSQNSLYGYLNTFCKESGEKYGPSFQKTVKPEVIVRSLRSESDVLPAMLMCSAYDYYPKGVRVSWLRDGELVSEGVSHAEDERSDGDWYYQMHTYLEYKARPGENISCMVEHESLTQPLIHTWDPPLPVEERNKLIIGISLLVFGIILAVTGFFYYMLRAKGNPEPATSSIRF